MEEDMRGISLRETQGEEMRSPRLKDMERKGIHGPSPWICRGEKMRGPSIRERQGRGDNKICFREMQKKDEWSQPQADAGERRSGD